MINTYQTSMAPPPVPPRLSGSHSVLIPAPLPSQGHSKCLVRFIVGVVLLHLFLSIGGFIYLNHNDKMPPSGMGVEGKMDYRSSEKQETSYKALARMVVDEQSRTSDQKSSLGYLKWDINHSVLRYIDYYHYSWLTIREPGDYYVYSRVTFSKGDAQLALVSKVNLRKNEKEEEKVVMQAYCNLDSSSRSALIPRLCTATQGEVITLEKGNQLGVWVQDLLLVNYEEGATTFGMYKL
ncbi:CD40 ligand [Anarrhichthys ocellatus]|uniref:CD40 ligand n=1 Tax=Anarrhichthys ocellatus TaxID=433405 RepID=UPI0012ECD50E|nr:tumor necrosis factor ligand superfamily member 6-like [Anarrhichthys ocellatus]